MSTPIPERWAGMYAKAKWPLTFKLIEEIAALEAQNQQLREALEEAATSLNTIATQAGRDECLTGMLDVRGYANSRAIVAQKALAATEAKEKA